jgi:putative transposase
LQGGGPSTFGRKERLPKGGYMVKAIQIAGNYYHIYNRSILGELLFTDPGSYTFLLRLIKEYFPQSNIVIIAYCLMPNHYHFLVRQDGDWTISRTVQRLFNAYVQGHNRFVGRRGPLFESHVKIKWIEKEEYLIHLCRYIHLNPVKAGLTMKPEDWIYSNYLDWIGKRSGTIIDHAFIDEHFNNYSDYIDFVNSILMDKDENRYFIDN